MADREDAQADEPITQRGLNIRILQRLQNDDVERAQRQEHSIELHNRLMEESRQRKEESRARIRHQDEMIALITRLVGAGTPQPAAEPAPPPPTTPVRNTAAGQTTRFQTELADLTSAFQDERPFLDSSAWRSSQPAAESTPAPRRVLVPGLTGRGDYTQEDLYATATGKRVPRDEIPYQGYEGSQELSTAKRGPKMDFPKWRDDDLELTLAQVESWFRYTGLIDSRRRIQFLGRHMEGRGEKWYNSKLRTDKHETGRLFNDWDYFVDRLKDLYGQRDERWEAYNKLHTLRLTSDRPGVATEHVNEFRNLEYRAEIDDERVKIHLFRSSLTPSIRVQFERDPPDTVWGWYTAVERIDKSRVLASQRLQDVGANSSLQPTKGNSRSERPVSTDRPAFGGSRPLDRANQTAPPLATSAPPRSRPLPPHLMTRPTQRPMPMQTGTTFGSNQCRVCGKEGHWGQNCPERLARAGANASTTRQPGPRAFVAVEDEVDHGHEQAEDVDEEENPYDGDLHLEDEPHAYDAPDDEGNEHGTTKIAGTVNGHAAHILADTGASLTLVSSNFVRKYCINIKLADQPTTIHGVGGHQLPITNQATLDICIGQQVLPPIEALVADIVDFDLILSYRLLQQLKPRINWETSEIEFDKSELKARSSAHQALVGAKDPSALRHPKLPQSSIVGSYGSLAPTLEVHGHEFVTASQLLQAALEDGPIGFMLMEAPPSSLPMFGFVPTGEDKGIEIEVEPEPKAPPTIPGSYRDFEAVFSEVEADKLPPRTETDLPIELVPGSKPPQGPLYLKGPKEMEELRKYLDENLAKGFIRPSKSPARSPVLFVPKKDGGLRLCVDYRGLNEVTVKNRAPLPLIEEQLFLLRSAKIFSKLDLKAAYNLVRIADGDEWKTAFGTQLGLYEYLVMPFGLANAPSHFQSLVNSIYRDIIGVYVVVYLDDFLIFSNSEEEHIGHVREVLRRLQANRLFAKLSKCTFHTDTVEFLGYIITPRGIEMDEAKVQTIKEWPLPQSIHDIQRFLGFANFYRRFISHFARITKPLTSLVKPTERFKKFQLPEEAVEAFHKLIEAFTTAGVLRHFNYHKPTRLETDASDFAIAGVLKQETEARWHPVAFYSRKMTSAEKNYKIHDKELLAIVACLHQWRHMLAGLPSQFAILSDHEALKYFKSQRRISGRQARWAVLLADFDFVVQYRPGDKAGEPDALTRRRDMEPSVEEQNHNLRQLLHPRMFEADSPEESEAREGKRRQDPNVGAKTPLPPTGSLVAEKPDSSPLRAPNRRPTIAVAVKSSLEPTPTMAAVAKGGLLELARLFQPLDAELKELHERTPFETKEGVWYKDGRLVIPKVTLAGKQGRGDTRAVKVVRDQSLSVEHLRFMVMTQCHDGVMAGHVGRDATIELAQRHYWWPSMRDWIADYVASCPVCARYKAPRHKPYGLLKPLATPSRPWSSLSMDFIEGLPLSNGYDSIFVVVDRLTKLAVLAPTYKTVTSEGTAELLQAQVFRRFGLPEHIVSDRGRQFISATWRSFAKSLSIQHSLSTAYHPQTDGQTERVNQVVEQYLRMYCNYEQDNWCSLLPNAEFVYNNAVHSSLGVSPFFACYGWNPKLHPEVPERVGVLDPTRKEFARSEAELTKYLQDQVRHAQARSVEQYNKKHLEMEFKVGDLVYVNRKNWKTRRPSPKLDTRFSGPYPITERIGRRAYRLQLPAAFRVHDVFHVSMLEKQRPSRLDDRHDLPTIPQLHDEDLEYEVEAIIGRRSTRGRVEYHVLWKGYPEEQATWEPVEMLSCPDLIQEYEEKAGGRSLRSHNPRRI